MIGSVQVRVFMYKNLYWERIWLTPQKKNPPAWQVLFHTCGMARLPIQRSVWNVFIAARCPPVNQSLNRRARSRAPHWWRGRALRRIPSLPFRSHAVGETTCCPLSPQVRDGVAGAVGAEMDFVPNPVGAFARDGFLRQFVAEFHLERRSVKGTLAPEARDVKFAFFFGGSFVYHCIRIIFILFYNAMQ